MPITTRDRKLLWAHAGNACAHCKNYLTEEAKGSDRDVVLGEEAHIVSEVLNGPRYRPMPIKEVDTYANLILLCPTDHKIVDEQVTTYTEQRLQAMKREHEQWVKDKIAPTMPSIIVRDPEAGYPLLLQRIDTGKELLYIVVHKFATHHDSPEPRSAEEAELMGGILQNTTNYIDIWDDIGPGGHVEAEFSMSEELTRLREAGLIVYAGARSHVVEVALAHQISGWFAM